MSAKPANIVALEAKLGVELVQCADCEGWHRATVLCGNFGCERLRAHAKAQEAAGISADRDGAKCQDDALLAIQRADVVADGMADKSDDGVYLDGEKIADVESFEFTPDIPRGVYRALDLSHIDPPVIDDVGPVNRPVTLDVREMQRRFPSAGDAISIGGPWHAEHVFTPHIPAGTYHAVDLAGEIRMRTPMRPAETRLVSQNPMVLESYDEETHIARYRPMTAEDEARTLVQIAGGLPPTYRDFTRPEYERPSCEPTPQMSHRFGWQDVTGQSYCVCGALRGLRQWWCPVHAPVVDVVRGGPDERGPNIGKWNRHLAGKFGPANVEWSINGCDNENHPRHTYGRDERIERMLWIAAETAREGEPDILAAQCRPMASDYQSGPGARLARPKNYASLRREAGKVRRAVEMSERGNAELRRLYQWGRLDVIGEDHGGIVRLGHVLRNVDGKACLDADGFELDCAIATDKRRQELKDAGRWPVKLANQRDNLTPRWLASTAKACPNQRIRLMQ